MVQEVVQRIKTAGKSDWLLVLIIILVGTLAFGIGRLSVIYGGGSDFKIIPVEAAGSVLGTSTEDDSQMSGAPSDGYVASKTGSKYHLPWCPGALTIKEENKLYFKTKEEAEARGYLPAGNCKGI